MLTAIKPRDLVASESPNRIRDHLDRKARYNPTKSLTSLTNQLTQEYEDRFLVELVQNSYDAHERGSRGGRVHVRFDESLPGQAVLYVANTGNAFTEANFDALTNVAQSSKPPGEGIGNKGVGFRSVLQVCDSPEIYSCDQNDRMSPLFDGFCFGFATDEQIRDMVASDAECEVILRDFSRYLLPVVVEPVDPQLNTLRAAGMVTVIRLPLTSTHAVTLARAQVRRLLDPAPPIALFLDRLASIAVELVDNSGKLESKRVKREVMDIRTADESPQLQWVDTVGQRFLTTTRTLGATEVSAVVREAISRRQLDSSWAGWDSNVEVALAVSVDGDDTTAQWPSTYTYLPMRVSAPAHAHLHAPFHTKLARLDLKEDSVFNSFLIRTAAQLAAETIRLLSSDAQLDLEPVYRRRAAIDLLCWDTNHLHELEAALEKLGFDLETSPVIPVRGPDGAAWAGLGEARTWRTRELAVLTTDAIEGHALLLDTAVGEQRAQRLSVVCRYELLRDLEPSDDEVAAWIEKIARGLESAPLATWNRFLNDVADVFVSRKATALRGRFVLLDDKRKLRRSGPWEAASTSAREPTVFFPPLPTNMAGDADEYAELSSVPKNLQRAITFLHEGIKVRTRSGSSFQRTKVGELLKSADLVEQFELTSVLGHLERLLAGNVSNTTYRQALSWVYAQERASRANVADLIRLRLHVPTATGWVPATEAVFSPGWGTARADAVAALVQESASASASLQRLRESAIVGPADWPFKPKDLDAFCDFLFRCGVRDGLFPVALRSRTAIRMNGVGYSPATIAHRFQLQDHAHWSARVNETWHPRFEGPYTPYTGSQELWIVPGQDAFETLGTHARDRLAAAILESLADWPNETERYVFQRRSPHHRNKPDPQVWPSPAKSFIERAAWFPMSDPGRREERYFVPVANGWTFDENTSEMAPRFARLAPLDHRRTLTASTPARSRLEDAGLKRWNSPASAAARLAELVNLVRSADIPANELPSIRRAASRAWSELVEQPDAVVAPGIELVVSRGSVVEVLEPSASSPPEVFLHDGSPGLVAQVLEVGNFPVLIADPADGAKITGLLESAPGYQVRKTSTIEAKVVLDGQALVPDGETGEELIGVFGPWMVRTILAIVDLRSSRFVRVTNKVLHEAEARLRKLRLIVGSDIELVVDERTLPAVGRLAESVHLNDLEHPLVVLNGSDMPIPSWRALEILADDLAELMGQAAVASEIRATALALQRSVDDWREPSDAELAKALRCSVESVIDVLHNLRTSTDHVRLLIAPFVGVEAGVDGARRIEAEPVGDTHHLKLLAAELIGPERADALFLSAERAESINAIRHDMGTDLGALNTVLAALGRDAVIFPDLHRAALNSYLDAHRIKLLDELRRRLFSQFDARADLAAYTAARDFHDVGPEASWLHAHETPTDSMLDELLSAWMNTKGEIHSTERTLDSVDEVRATNQSLLDRGLPAIADVVRAWTVKHGTQASDAWTDMQQVRDKLGESGALDFIVLAEAELLAWINLLGLWPAAMPVTLDHEELDVSAADLAAGQASKSASEQGKRRRRTELPFANRTYDTASSELHDFADAIDASVTDAFLKTRATLTKLADVPSGKRGASGARGGGSSRFRGAPKPTDEVTAAIGLAGEILAYRWLRQTYPEATPDSWVSRNRRFTLGGHPGRDSLGYDFRIARKNETLLFEVKATTTDEYAFDIGESELRAARATRRSWYRIIFIKSVLTPADRELLVLPHPLDPCYAQVNQGIRLRFDPI